MIKKLLMICLGLMAIGALAQNGTQYSWGEYYTIDTSKGHNLVTQSATNLSVTMLSSKNYTSFGYFTFDSAGNILTQGTLNFDANGVASLGNFDSGTNVGFWLETAAGKVYSVQSMNTNYFYAANRYEYTSAGDPIFRMGGYGNYSLDDIRFTIDAKAASSPTGQPLPGVIVTAMLALGCGTLFCRKRQKKA